MCIRITAYNRGPDPATLHIIPQLWFPNTWSWPLPTPPRPNLRLSAPGVISATEKDLGTYHLYCTPSPPPGAPVGAQEEPLDEEDEEGVVPELMFTENDTNFERLYGGTNTSPYVKDAFHDHIIPSHRPVKTPSAGVAEVVTETVKAAVAAVAETAGVTTSSASDGHATPTQSSQSLPGSRFINPDNTGTKSGAHYTFTNVPGRGGVVVVRLKFTQNTPDQDESINDEEVFDDTVDERRRDADEFYARLIAGQVTDDLKAITRQALGGMMWYVIHIVPLVLLFLDA